MPFLVRSIQTYASGKYYFEMTLNVATTLSQVGVGVDNDSESVEGAGGNAGSIIWLGNGSINYNGTANAYTAATFAVGNILGVAVDVGAKLIWFRVGSGNWNNSGTANPSTGAGGLSISAIATVFAIAQLAVAGDQITANFPGPFTNAAPAGFLPFQQIAIGGSTFVDNSEAAFAATFAAVAGAATSWFVRI